LVETGQKELTLREDMCTCISLSVIFETDCVLWACTEATETVKHLPSVSRKIISFVSSHDAHIWSWEFISHKIEVSVNWSLRKVCFQGTHFEDLRF